MVGFACDRCGKCCVSLGSLITIERQVNDQDYYCRCKIDNTIFLAHVDPAYRGEIADEYADGDTALPGVQTPSCRFLRKNREGEGTACAIYPARPKVCQDFRCYRMIIRNGGGAVCGRVIGKNTLRTEDTVLENLWKEHVMTVPAGDSAVWIRTVTGILADNGYRADPVE